MRCSAEDRDSPKNLAGQSAQTETLASFDLMPELPFVASIGVAEDLAAPPRVSSTDKTRLPKRPPLRSTPPRIPVLSQSFLRGGWSQTFDARHRGCCTYRFMVDGTLTSHSVTIHAHQKNDGIFTVSQSPNNEADYHRGTDKKMRDKNIDPSFLPYIFLSERDKRG